MLVELDDARILTDPVLRGRVAHLRRDAPALEPGDLDAVLISHGHHDHLHFPSLKRLPHSVRVVAPRGLGPLIARHGFEHVLEVEAGDELDVAGLTVRATHAEHGSTRPGSSAQAVPIGYALLGSRRVFFAGDTDLFPGMDGLVPELDVALLPIWGWGPTLGAGHLNPVRAAEALTLLRPRIAVPIHWGTLRPMHRRAGAAFLRRPVDAFVAAAREQAPQVEVRVLEPGESFELD